jgi:hypothetical protein
VVEYQRIDGVDNTEGFHRARRKASFVGLSDFLEKLALRASLFLRAKKAKSFRAVCYFLDELKNNRANAPSRIEHKILILYN